MTASACSNCGNAHDPTDVFCENCGLDFLSGSLPAPLDPPAGAPTPETDAAEPGSPAAEPATATVVLITVDEPFYRLMAPDGEVAFPDPLPAPVEQRVAGDEVFIGRASQSRGVYPDIDVAAATGDPAVSTQHAVLRKTGDDAWTLRDLDSTNGTYVGEPDNQIVAGVAVPIETDTAIFVGAYTKIVIAPAATPSS